MRFEATNFKLGVRISRAGDANGRALPAREKRETGVRP